MIPSCVRNEQFSKFAKARPGLCETAGIPVQCKPSGRAGSKVSSLKGKSVSIKLSEIVEDAQDVESIVNFYYSNLE